MVGQQGDGTCPSYPCHERERLKQCHSLPLLNPIDSELLVSIDAQGCNILPSAHFPLLLPFDCQERANVASSTKFIFGQEKMYQTKVELVEVKGSLPWHGASADAGRRFTVHGSVAGTFMGSGQTIKTSRDSTRHIWDQGDVLTFDSRLSWGAPQTLSLRVSEGSDKIVNADETSKLEYENEVRFCWEDLAPMWQHMGDSSSSDASTTVSCHAQVWSSDAVGSFDEHGDLPGGPQATSERLEIELKVTTKAVNYLSTGLSSSSSRCSRNRSLLYTHDNDVRQEMFAIEFVHRAITF
jgi:hypothetical protein